MLCGLVIAPGAQAGGPNNVVLTTATGDSPLALRSHLQAAPFGGDVLDSTNLAHADSHDCTGCRSVAVAIQAVFVTGQPSFFSPRNLAVATNESCTSCVTFAFAYQYIVSTHGPFHLGEAGRAQLRQLRHEFGDLAGSGLPPAQLEAQLNQLAGEFKADIDTQIRQAGDEPRGDVHEQQDESPAGS
jgi:hypothetical protein